MANFTVILHFKQHQQYCVTHKKQSFVTCATMIGDRCEAGACVLVRITPMTIQSELSKRTAAGGVRAPDQIVLNDVKR